MRKKREISENKKKVWTGITYKFIVYITFTVDAAYNLTVPDS